MDVILFITIFFTVLIYLAIQVIASYKIIRLNSMGNNLVKEGLDEANFLLKVSIFSVGILFLIFAVFYIPRSFSDYQNIIIQMLIDFVGLFVVYELSSKTIKDLFNINILMNIVNCIMFSLPVFILLLTSVIY